jgi:hypothetical protein
MSADHTTRRPDRTDRWTPARIFRSTLALTFGLVTALILMVGILYLLFGSGERVTLVEGDSITEDVTVDEESAAALELALADCPDDACILPMPRRQRVDGGPR